MKTITLRGHRWIVLDEPSTLGKDFVLLQRKNYLADLKRYGQVATRIDVSRDEVTK